MKLMYCVHCGDMVKLFPEERTCLCGKSSGHYLPDNSTTVQTWPSLSVGIANPDFADAERQFREDPHTFSPLLAMRCWINPVSESDVQFTVDGNLIEFVKDPSTASLEDGEALMETSL